jgi:hypothetical protein
MPLGERVFAGIIGLLGLFWIYQASRLTYWDGFAPGTGFLPLWLAVALVALVALLLLTQGARPAPAPAPPQAPGRHRRAVAIMAGLAVSAVVLEFAGFVVTIGGYLLYLLAFVERRGPAQTGLVAGGTTLALFLIFHTWLGVPLPKGPWGF